jgi:hypothetical protein
VQHQHEAVCVASSHGRAAVFFQEATATALAVLDGIGDGSST